MPTSPTDEDINKIAAVSVVTGMNPDEVVERFFTSRSTPSKSANLPDEDAITFAEENRGVKLENDHKEQVIELQKEMFRWVNKVVTLWLWFMAGFLSVYVISNTFLSILGVQAFHLEKEILITLLATTTINIIGLPLVITKSLFREDSNKK